MRPAAFVIVLAFAAQGCDRNPAEPPAEIIAIGSIGTPARIEAGAAFMATFTGGSCYSLQRVDRDSSATSIDFAFVGVPRECNYPPGYGDAVPFLQREQIQAPTGGELSIRVHQPTGAVLTKVIAVSPPA
jgi:hypothetical protein